MAGDKRSGHILAGSHRLVSGCVKILLRTEKNALALRDVMISESAQRRDEQHDVWTR